MPRRLAEVGEGHEDGNGVYGIIRDLIVEGKDARFVNKKGRFVVNWSRALDCFTDYKAKKNPQFKSKAVSRRKISNGFRSALLNYYKKEGAKEYKDAKKVNENDEVVERQFQMPPRLFKSMFRDVGPTVTEDSEEDDQEDTSSLVSSEGDDKPEVSRSTSTSDTGFDEFMDMSSHEIVEPLESSLAVAGNFLTDLGLDVIKTEGEETSVGLSDGQLPPASEMFDPSMLDSAIEEICSDGISDDISDEGIDLFGVVQDICPTSGSVKGGFQFYISLTEELPDEVKTGVAQFERVANVMVYKLNPFTLTGTVPSSQVPGEVAVTVVTDAGKKLGMTCFRYIDEMREMVRQIVKDPTLQSLWFAMWSQEHGFFGNDSNIAQVLGPIDLQGQDSSVQTKQQQSVKVLQLLVYTAAQTDAREFIEMVFSTSAGQIVFNSYKDRTPLPEDVALANGHEELAQYLTDINTRLSKETFEDVQSCTIDWLELVKAVQKQSSQDESTKGLQQPSDIDDTSDYFADVETSSCGSSDHDIVWTNMSENKAAWKCPRGSPILQESCTDEDIFNDVHPVGTTMSENGLSNKCPLKATNSDETLKKAEESTQRPTTRPVVDKKGTPRKREAQLDNENDKEGVTYGSFAHTFDCISRWWRKKDSGPIARAQDNCLDEKEEELPSKSRSLFQGLFWRGSDTSEANVHGASGPHMTMPKECHKRPGHATGRSTRKKEAGLNYKGVVLTFALLTVLAGFKLKEGQILHWAVGNGYTQFSKMLLQCGVYVDVPGLLKETPLHLAAKNGFRDLVDVLVQSGGNVNARNFPMQETPLHLATRNGHRFIAQFLVQQGSQVNARNVPWQETPLHLATRNGHRHIAQFLVQQGSQVNARNVPSRETPLHLASRNGHLQIAEFLIHHGSQVNARNAPWQETPLQLALKNGHQQIAEFLIKTGGLVNAWKRPWKETALYLASRNGHQQIAEVLIQHGRQVDARNIPWQETPLHLAAMNRQQQIAEFLMQHGDLVNDRNIPVQETPLHQDTRNGLQQIAESLVQQESSANNSNVPLQETSLHRAEKNGHQPAVEFLILKRSQNDARILPMRETPPHLVSQNGCQAIQIAVPLSHNGGQVHARKVETAFHWARKSGPRHTSQFLTQPNDISSRRNENYLPSQLVARNGQHRGVVNVKNSSLHANFLNLASRTGRRQIAESSIRRGIEITAKDIQRQETSFIQQRSGINVRICEKDVSSHWAARNESCRLKSSPELVVRRLSQVSVSSVLCHWLKKKFSATSDVISSARRKIPRLRLTRGGVLWNCVNEIDLIFKTQTKSPIFTEKHQQASLGAKDLVDQSLVQSQMSIRKEKLLTHAFSSLSNSESFSSSDRNTSQVWSWYTTVLCVDGKCGKDGINWVLTNNFTVIIGYCVGLCFVFVALNLSFFWRNKQTVCFARHCSILPFLHCITGSEVKCIRTKGPIETKEGDKCVKEAADNGALGDKGRTQTISTKNSASELFERKFFPEVETFGYQQLNKDKSVRRLRMERVRKWLECNHDQDVLSSVESEVELSPTMSRFSSSTMVKELTFDETINIEMPESADTVPPMVQSHAVTGSVQETYTAVSCMPCTDEEIFNDVHPVGTTMSENGPSNKCPLKAMNSDEKLKKAEESTQRPTTRLLVDKKGTPSKHEAHACTRVPPMAQSHAITGSLRGTYTAVPCMLCRDEDIFNDVHSVGTTMSENGLSNKCSLQETNSDKKLKKAEESTQRPTTRPVVDKKGTPSKHEAHACTRVPPMAQSHAVTGSLQGTDTAVSCIPCGHGCYRCHRCEKCSSCGNKDVLVNCLIKRVAVCSKSCKSKTHYFNESDGQCYPCTECCGKDKMNIEPVPLKRKEKDSSFFSMGEDSHEPMSFTAGDMRFGQQFQGVTITSTPSELPTSSSPQPSYSNPPAYPYNIGHTSFSLSSATGNRNASISPINTGPYDNVSSYSEASPPGPSMSPPNMFSVVSRLPTIPSTTEYPGGVEFQISFGPLTKSALKSATWTYSDVCKKLYVNLASFCPIKCKTKMPPPHGTVLRTVAVFKGSTSLHGVVKRCPNHMESSKDGSAPKDQFIHSNNPAAHYHTCPETLRHSVLLPYNGPQVGTAYVTEMFAFMCFSSCASGPSRRPVEVIFTLEKDGQTLGRRVVEIRVCACPGRDRKSDERTACGEPSSSQAAGKRSRKGSGNRGPGANRRRISSRNSTDEEEVRGQV